MLLHTPHLLLSSPGMDRKRRLIHLLQVCLLLWIGISVSVAQEDIIATTPLAGGSPMANTARPEETTGGSPMANTAGPEDTTGAALPLDSSVKCHHSNCTGEHCYANESISGDSSEPCSTYCAVYRHNSSYFERKCDDRCMNHLCNGSQQDGCTLHCCDMKGCTALPNTGNSGTEVMSTAAPTIMPTTTSTAKPIVYSDKICRSFKCDGMDCFKNQAALQMKPCQVGTNHCELQKIVRNGAVSYEGGCSNTCSSSTKSCAAITNGNCFQECCNATKAGCCMKLDGQVHFNTATLVRKGSILKIFTCAFFVIFISRFISSSFV